VAAAQALIPVTTQITLSGLQLDLSLGFASSPNAFSSCFAEVLFCMFAASNGLPACCWQALA
jgi:hypothetical protein